MERLTPEQIETKRGMGLIVPEGCRLILSSEIENLFDTIEAQQQEIERLNKTLDDWKYNVKCDADHIAGLLQEIDKLVKDKDEQAGRIMELDNGLKKLRTSFQWLSETINDLDYKAWAEDKIDAIDALLGGNEDV